jgi:hypothetical protein
VDFPKSQKVEAKAHAVPLKLEKLEHEYRLLLRPFSLSTQRRFDHDRQNWNDPKWDSGFVL